MKRCKVYSGYGGGNWYFYSDGEHFPEEAVRFDEYYGVEIVSDNWKTWMIVPRASGCPFADWLIDQGWEVVGTELLNGG